MSFVHLHTHSHYSLLDGVPKIPELITAVKRKGMNAVALTDHGNLYGAIEFYEEAKKQGIKPIIGIEVYIAPTTIEEKNPREKPFHGILLAKNKTGYEKLIQLTSIAHLDGFYSKPRIDKQLLKEHREGLIMLSGCLSGEIPKTILLKGVDAAEEVLREYLTIFDMEDFFLEVQHNPNTPEQATVNAGLLELHQRTGVELVATNDVHYIEPEDSEAQDVMLCIQTKSLLAQENRMTMRNEDFSLSTPEQMIERFVDYPRAVENTQKIADRISIDIELGTIQMPFYSLEDGISPQQALRSLCEEGLQKKYTQRSNELNQRLEYELDVINKTGFSSYFLIVADFINWAKEKGIAVGPGRGSAAGSLVSYLTGITDIDPIQYELLFERFLNPERVSQPDIDTDFADIRRDDVLEYVEEKYGKDHVAQIITFGTMAARAALRDVGRVLGLSYGYCDRIAKMIPMFTTLQEALDTVSELSELVNQDPDAQRLVAIALKLEGVVRHTSTHACAVVITKDPLTQQVPLQKDQDGAIITQYSMHPIEHLGLLKMDFLGLKNLTIIENTLNIIQATTGDEIHIDSIPLNDKKTFKLLQQAETVGVFQLESSGMRRYLKLLKPTDMEDIIAMVSLYRPGPMDFIPDYIDGKHGKREISYLSPLLEPLLKKTYGIAVYQEQIMEIARQLAGYSYGEADVLRKAVGKKIKSLLDEQEQKMISGMTKNGISPDVAKKIWEFILPFARYGFNRSHAACYAMIAYRTAYLKANYPAQFMAALLTADYGNSERIALEVVHAEQMGMTILPPDINESYGTFTVVAHSLEEQQPRIRFGLKAIKNVGDHIVDVIIRERKAHGPYVSMQDFLTRVKDKDVNKKSLESLVKVGAFDVWHDRNELLFNMEVLLQFSKRVQEEERNGQSTLFAGSTVIVPSQLNLAEAPPTDHKTSLQWEKELLGLYISGHPLSEYRAYFEQHDYNLHALREHPKNRKVEAVGMVTTIKKITTKSGESMVFAGFADYTSEIEILVFPKTYQKNPLLWVEDAIVKVKGKLDDKDGQLKILVEEAESISLEHIQNASIKKITIRVPIQMKKSVFTELKELLNNAEQGDFRVFLLANSKEIDTGHLVSATAVEGLNALFGRDAVSVLE